MGAISPHVSGLIDTALVVVVMIATEYRRRVGRAGELVPAVNRTHGSRG